MKYFTPCVRNYQDLGPWEKDLSMTQHLYHSLCEFSLWMGKKGNWEVIRTNIPRETTSEKEFFPLSKQGKRTQS